MRIALAGFVLGATLVAGWGAAACGAFETTGGPDGGASSGGSGNTSSSSSSSGAGVISGSGSSGGGKDAQPDAKPECPASAISANALDDFYKPGAPPAPGACTPTDIALITGKPTIVDIVAALEGTSPACKACALTSDGAAATQWAPLVTIVRGGAPLTISNWGACIADKSTQACGELEQKFQLCYVVACQQCTGADADKCRTTAYDGPSAVCQKYASDLQSSNGCDINSYQLANNACGSDIVRHIKGHCGDP